MELCTAPPSTDTNWSGSVSLSLSGGETGGKIMKYYNFHWEYYRHMAAWEPGKNTNNFVMITLSTVWGPFYNSYQLFVSSQPAHQLATVWSLYLHGWLPSKSQSDNELTCLLLTEAHWWNINLCLPLSLKSYFGAFMMSELRAHSCLIAASCLPPARQPLPASVINTT